MYVKSNGRFNLFVEICRISCLKIGVWSVGQAREFLDFEHPEHTLVYKDPQILQYTCPNIPHTRYTVHV